MDDGNKYLLKFPDPTREKAVIYHILIMLSQNIYPVLFITSLEFQHKKQSLANMLMRMEKQK